MQEELKVKIIFLFRDTREIILASLPYQEEKPTPASEMRRWGVGLLGTGIFVFLGRRRSRKDA